MTFEERLLALKKRFELNNTELTKLAGVSRQAVNEWLFDGNGEMLLGGSRSWSARLIEVASVFDQLSVEQRWALGAVSVSITKR